MKKVFIILSCFFAVTLFFWGVYNFAFKKDFATKNIPALQEDDRQKTEKFLTEKKQQGKIYPITDEKVIGAVYEKKQERIIYYNEEDGTTWSIDPDGKNKEQLSDKKLTGLKSLAWTGDRNKVISELEKDGEKKFYVYDFKESKASEIKKIADLITWDNLGSKIIYKYFDEQTKKRSLNIADQDGSNWKALVEDLPFRKVSIKAVPQTSLISYWNYPAAQEESKLQTASMLGGEVKTVFAGRFGADYLWSPAGERALVSSLAAKGESKLSLGIVDLSGKYIELGIPTFANKCAWSQDKKTVYCALPGSIPAGAILPDAYQENKFHTEDTFWKIDTASGQKERVLELTEMKEGYDATNIFLSASEDAMFFTNKTDGKLYKVEL